MNRFKGTPAPWIIATMGPNGCPIIGDKPTMVAMLAHSVNEKGQELEATLNANIIAAAPELLSELIRLRNIIASYKQDSGDNLDITDAVIAKALGEVK